MDGVACEIIGTYNALTMVGNDIDYLKLAIEFEYNATLYPAVIDEMKPFIPTGTWGSDPRKIGHCLDAYNVTSYTVFDKKNYSSWLDACKAYEEAFKSDDTKCGIVSDHWPYKDKFYIPIHTFAVVYNHNNPEKWFRTFNDKTAIDHEAEPKYVDYTSIYNRFTDDVENKNNNQFMIGYILN
ncbi:MAG: hypothetical protein Q4F95_09245 [Oscillospiraceae bacterium]|nr:hypothetical protein [Oscillospiraceae bacterium]